MTSHPRQTLQETFANRFSDAAGLEADDITNATLHAMAQRGACRDFTERAVPASLLDILCATAMASPTKSDLQQRDIVLLQSPSQRLRLSELVSGQGWVAQAPVIAVFCGNNRRQRLLHQMHGVPFANDHLDALFNAAADAAIALGAFVTAAESLGLGCCPISAVRNKAAEVSDMLELPDHVFPFAGLAIGYPSRAPEVSKRLPLGVTCHVDRYEETDLESAIRDYDKDRAATQPYRKQRLPKTFGTSENYGWSQDKARQYSVEERADFGAFVRAKGFCLD